MLLSRAPLSDDIFRYYWDGKVTVHGINPYAYSPDADLLGPLRDSNWERVQNKDVHTMYPPFAQAIFAAAYAIFPGITSLRLLSVSFSLLAIGVLIRILAKQGVDIRYAILYAWSPLATIEFAPMPFAQEVRALYVGGFMRGVSVGFRALESGPRDGSSTASGHGARRHGVVFKRQELLEISAAPVPLNAMALAVQESPGAAWPRTLREPQDDGLTQVGAGETIEEELSAGEQERAEAAAMLREIGELWRELTA